MLAGHLTNQDEDEVEDELEALQRELAGPVVLPSPPTAIPAPAEAEPEPAPSRERNEAKAETRTAVPA
jgi:charged multivesicular body protein 6